MKRFISVCCILMALCIVAFAIGGKGDVSTKTITPSTSISDMANSALPNGIANLLPEYWESESPEREGNLDVACTKTSGAAQSGFTTNVGTESWARWIDPSTCASAGYPFRVDSVNFQLAGGTAFSQEASIGTLEYKIRIVCTTTAGADPCAGPGLALIETPVMSYTAASPSLFRLGKLFSPGVCVNGPFFIVLEFVSWTGTGMIPTVLFSSTADPACYDWLWQGADPWGLLPRNFVTRVSGNTSDTCTPLVCVPQTGACCDIQTGTCVDGVLLSECTGLNATFYPGATCASLNPPCTQCTPPANDFCSGAIPLTNGVRYCGTAACDLLECANDVPAVWHSFTLAQAANISVDYCGSLGAPNAYASIFTGCLCGTGTAINYSSFDNTSCGDGNYTIYYNAVPAGTYYVAVIPDLFPNYCVKVTELCTPVDYLANPIEVFTYSYHYEATVNSCCATNSIDTTCGYVSGGDVIFKVCVDPTITVSASGPCDNQLMIFTDISDPKGSIIACADNGIAGDPEVLSNVTIAGYSCFYIAVSCYNTGCGNITLILDSDAMLPVELTTFTATAGNNEVTLNWSTASETNNDRFEIVRGTETVGSVSSAGAAHDYTWVDSRAINGKTYDYTLYSVGVMGERNNLRTVSATPNMNSIHVTDYALYSNFPNPFNPTTDIMFDMKASGNVSLKVYNLLGQVVATLANGTMEAGHHTMRFDATNLPSGLYICKMEANGFSAQSKMMLMK